MTMSIDRRDLDYADHYIEQMYKNELRLKAIIYGLNLPYDDMQQYIIFQDYKIRFEYNYANPRRKTLFFILEQGNQYIILWIKMNQ